MNEGLLRCGKSCRLRWLNYLRPDIKRGNITPDEDDLIIRLHSLLGNRWSLIAGRLPGRTDNEIKNYWNCHLSKRLMKNSTAGNKSRCMGGSAGKRSGTKASNKRKQKEDSDGISGRNGEAAAKIKIYLPKAIKACPSSCTKYLRNIQSMIGSSPRNVEVVDHTMSGLKAANNGGQGWGSNNEELDGLVCDLDSSYPIPLQNDIMLDDIFGEFQQLLKEDGNNGGQGWGSNNEELDGLVCDLDSSYPIPLQNDIMLDDILGEFQQLLKEYGIMDSFVDSLLA